MLSIKEIKKEIYQKQKEYLEKLKVNDPESYQKIKKARRSYYLAWRKKHPDYNKNWLRKYYKKYPEKFAEYQRRFWRKKRALEEVKQNETNR